MENLIIILIWGAIAIVGAVSKSRKKNARSSNQDQLEQQWQELVQKKAKVGNRTASPAPAPQRTGRTDAGDGGLPPPRVRQTPRARPQTPQVQQSQWQVAEDAVATPLSDAPATAVVYHAPSHQTQQYMDPSAADSAAAKVIRSSSTGGVPIRRKARSELIEMMTSRKALRRAILLREILDRPRAYDT